MFLNFKVKKIIFILMILFIIKNNINTNNNKLKINSKEDKIKDKKEEFIFSEIINNYLDFKKILTEDFVKEISLNLLNKDKENTENFIKDFYDSELDDIYKILTEDERLNKKFKDAFKKKINEKEFKIILNAKVGMEYLKYSIIGEENEIFNYKYILGSPLDKILLIITDYINFYEEDITKSINSKKIKNIDGKKTILLVKRFIDKYTKIISKSYCDNKTFDCFAFLKELAGIKENIELVLFSSDEPYKVSMTDQVRAIANVYSYAKRMKSVYSLK